MSKFAALQLAAQRVSDHYDKHPDVPIEWELPEGALCGPPRSGTRLRTAVIQRSMQPPLPPLTLHLHLHLRPLQRQLPERLRLLLHAPSPSRPTP